MAMTAAVKDELSRLEVTKPCCRKAEMAALLRFGGALHLVEGRVVVEAELDTGVAARRLRKDVAEMFGHHVDVHVVAATAAEAESVVPERLRAAGRTFLGMTRTEPSLEDVFVSLVRREGGAVIG